MSQGIGLYTKFDIHAFCEQTGEHFFDDAVVGIFDLCSSINSMLSATNDEIAVSVTERGAEALNPMQGKEADQWSLWYRRGSAWAYRCIGATDLDELSESFLDVLQFDLSVDQILICPPGASEPARV